MAYPATAQQHSSHGLPTRPAGPALRSVQQPRPARDVRGRAADAGLDLSGPLSSGSLAVDLAGYVVTVDGQPLDLSPRQVELLALFLAAPRKVWSRDQLHWVAWGDTTPSRRVDVQLCRLRAKTGIDLFRNVRDRGWALRPL
jgi:DNA-binding response OmpR family regulator